MALLPKTMKPVGLMEHLERHQEIFRFARDMIAFRDAHPVLS